MKNRRLPQPRFTDEGQYRLDNDADRYGALLQFVRNLSGCPRRDAEELTREAGALARQIETTTYRVHVDFRANNDGVRHTRAVEVAFTRPVVELVHARDCAADRLYEDESLSDVEVLATRLVSIR